MPRALTKKAKAARKRRAEEMEEEREQRLLANSQRNAATRSAEDDIEREQRLLNDSQRLAATRSAEGDLEREQRLLANSQRNAATRSAEDDIEREQRLLNDSQRLAAARVAEDDLEREQRLLANSQRNYEARAAENEVDRIQRQRIDAQRHNQRNRRMRQQTNVHRIALNYTPQFEPLYGNIGDMDVICVKCGALKFKFETKSVCCCNGKVILNPFPTLPAFLQDLINGESPKSTHFLSHIREYNNCFAMTSFAHREAQVPGWNPSFRVEGNVYHLIGSLLPQTETQAKFLQVYFLDSLDSEIRARQYNNLDNDILHQLTHWFHEHNHLIRSLKTAREEIEDGNIEGNRKIVIREDKRPTGEHARRYNAQTAPEVAILMEEDATQPRDIVLKLREGGLKRINELHPSYDALQYPIAFPHGTDGYSIYLKAVLADGQREGRKVTQMQYYSYHIMVRVGNHLLKLKRLFQQILVDAYCKIETERLSFLRREQRTLRADNYTSLHDNLVINDGDPQNVGQRVVLPATYTGGPRWMHARQADAMAYVRRMGRPDLFITMTTNPKWEEIISNLLPGQEPHDRPDIIARVFSQKLKCLVDLIKKGVLGKMQAFLYTIETQKRGLPHCHLLLWVAPEDKIRPNEIDSVISAELPDIRHDPILHKLVLKHMIHGPCGAVNTRSPCMKNGKCDHGFPKQFLLETEQGQDSYPKYRRRTPEDGGFSAQILRRQEGSNVIFDIDNRWVVPYNPFLIRNFACHINVEICSSINSIKYVTKYITKGTDQAVFQLLETDGQNNIDEISLFQNARYVGSSEAVWRILEHHISEHFPPVVGLDVHLENGQRVYFNEDNAREIANQQPPPTKLTAFF